MFLNLNMHAAVFSRWLCASNVTVDVTETRTLRDGDVPLLERILLGPLEDNAKIFIIDRQQTIDITEEVGGNIFTHT